MVRIGIATLKEREKSLKKTMRSLAQADNVQFFLYLNKYLTYPQWLKDFNVGHATLDPKNTAGDRGKFAFPQQGLCFTCDDDIIYPENYIAETTNKLQHYSNKVIGTYHGKLASGKVRSFYRGLATHHFMQELSSNTRVQIPGTGVMAWHADTIQLPVEIFEQANMADIYVGIEAHKQSVPIMCLERPEKWFESMYQPNNIFDQNHRDDSKQTQLVNSVRWA